MPVDFLSSQVLREIYTKMLLIRKFEEKLTALAREKARVVGMQILAYGQEALAVGVVEALNPDDVVVSNHRRPGN